MAWVCIIREIESPRIRTVPNAPWARWAIMNGAMSEAVVERAPAGTPPIRISNFWATDSPSTYL